eukprot:IDg5135t1
MVQRLAGFGRSPLGLIVAQSADRAPDRAMKTQKKQPKRRESRDTVRRTLYRQRAPGAV